MQQRENDRNRNGYDAGRVSQDVLSAYENKNRQREREERHVQQLADHHVGPKADGERKDSREMADGFNDQHDDVDREKLGHGAEQRLRVVQATVFADSDGIVIEKHYGGEAQRDRDGGGGRGNSWNKRNHVAKQNKNADGCDDRNMAVGAMADDVVDEILYADAHRIRDHEFHGLLRGTGTVRADAGPEPQEEQDSDQDDEQLHRERIGDGVFGAVRLDV